MYNKIIARRGSRSRSRRRSKRRLEYSHRALQQFRLPHRTPTALKDKSCKKRSNGCEVMHRTLASRVHRRRSHTAQGSLTISLFSSRTLCVVDVLQGIGIRTWVAAVWSFRPSLILQNKKFGLTRTSSITRSLDLGCQCLHFSHYHQRRTPRSACQSRAHSGYPSKCALLPLRGL